ncbi:hypothetical protein, partial [Burkholderia stagnalis]|uniref:hypothetical protein n=1 Tax=Burkholderia stagnalis TaxID=1503054 RepID=UPI001C89218C
RKYRCQKRQKIAPLQPFESAFYPVSAGAITAIIPGAITPIRDNSYGVGRDRAWDYLSRRVKYSAH